MKIYKTVVSVSDDPEYQGKVFAMDTIKYEGKFWLVPEWTDLRSEGLTMGFGSSGTVEKVECRRCGLFTTRRQRDS